MEPESVKFPEDNDPLDQQGRSVFEKPITDQYISTELNLSQGDIMRNAKVIRWFKDGNGETVGAYDKNLFLNTIVYDVQFPDGEIKEYVVNVIAENMYSQVDTDGYRYQILDCITDHRKNKNALEKDELYITTKSGHRRMRQTMAGWNLLVMKNGQQEWMPLSILKNLNPLEATEYASAWSIDNEPAFVWWVPYTLQRRDRIIAGVNSRVKCTSHKYDIEISRTVEEALKLDKLNGNNLWRKAINKEMENLKVSFDILPEGSKLPPRYKPASGHLVFDVRMTLETKEMG